MIKQKILHVDLDRPSYRVREYEGYLGPLDLGVHLHLEVYKSYEAEVYSGRNIVFLGRGPFAGGGLFGAHRMIAVFRSPLTRGLHVSALGGAGYRFLGTGLHGVVVEGRASEPVIIMVRGSRDGGVDVVFEGVRDLEGLYKGYKGLRGVRALAEYVIDNYWDFIRENMARMVLVGPAAFKSSMGAIYSPNLDYESKKILVEDWAARGGGGSVLARAHNVAGIVFGGEAEPGPPVISRFDSAKGLLAPLTGGQYVKAVYESTTKYSYDQRVRTGGTFGSNYVVYRENVPMFNWRMIDLTREEREKLYELIRRHFEEPFKKRIIDTMSWRTCGEPCPVRCKKVTEEGKHVDFEPFNGCGPLIGVLDFDEALRVVSVVDELGYDAIEAGNVLAWIMEALEKGLLQPEELGVNEKPRLDPTEYDTEHSKLNAEVAVRILEEMTWGDNWVLRLIADKGLRAAAKILDEKFRDRVEELGYRFEDLGVYIPYGREGHITPNYYWSPGMLAPLAVLGRYWTLYTIGFFGPRDYARSSLERALKEYLLDNAGWCRFHRRWVEDILPELYRAVYGVNVDLMEHARRAYRRILEYQLKAGAWPTFWDSSRVIRIIWSSACEFGSREWCDAFNQDPQKAARAWWEEFLSHLEEYLGVRVPRG